ncbi:unnamed protein product, partial [Amoebophrya sp. A25]|eukprot:GSA25T00011325001.1
MTAFELTGWKLRPALRGIYRLDTERQFDRRPTFWHTDNKYFLYHDGGEVLINTADKYKKISQFRNNQHVAKFLGHREGMSWWHPSCMWEERQVSGDMETVTISCRPVRQRSLLQHGGHSYNSNAGGGEITPSTAGRGLGSEYMNHPHQHQRYTPHVIINTGCWIFRDAERACATTHLQGGSVFLLHSQSFLIQ